MGPTFKTNTFPRQPSDILSFLCIPFLHNCIS